MHVSTPTFWSLMFLGAVVTVALIVNIVRAYRERHALGPRTEGFDPDDFVEVHGVVPRPRTNGRPSRVRPSIRYVRVGMGTGRNHSRPWFGLASKRRQELQHRVVAPRG